MSGRAPTAVGRTVRTLFSAALVVITAAAATAGASSVEIELNKLENQENSCRANLVVKNKSDSAFDSLKLDLVLFDTEGIVAKRLAVEAAPLPAGKTSLKVFDIDDLPCAGIGRMLLNDIMACTDSAGRRDDCVALISTSARGAVSFIK